VLFRIVINIYNFMLLMLVLYTNWINISRNPLQKTTAFYFAVRPDTWTQKFTGQVFESWAFEYWKVIRFLFLLFLFHSDLYLLGLKDPDLDLDRDPIVIVADPNPNPSGSKEF